MIIIEPCIALVSNDGTLAATIALLIIVWTVAIAHTIESAMRARSQEAEASDREGDEG